MCRDDWHEGQTCEEAIEGKLEGWAKEKGGVKFCPVCRTKIEKNEGCNHMKCVICQYEFCWNCLDYAGQDSDHFNPMNPNSCGIGIMEDRPSSRLCRIFAFIMTNLCFLIALPILAVFWLPVTFAWMASKLKLGGCMNVSLITMAFIFGFLFVPIIAPLTILLFLVAWIASPFIFCCNMIAQKQNRIRR